MKVTTCLHCYQAILFFFSNNRKKRLSPSGGIAISVKKTHKKQQQQQQQQNNNNKQKTKTKTKTKQKQNIKNTQLWRIYIVLISEYVSGFGIHHQVTELCEYH